MSLTDKEEAFAARVAEVATAKLIEQVTDPDFAEKAIDTYSSFIQKAVGKAVIKTGLWILLALVAWAGWKLGIFQKMLP